MVRDAGTNGIGSDASNWITLHAVAFIGRLAPSPSHRLVHLQQIRPDKYLKETSGGWW